MNQEFFEVYDENGTYGFFLDEKNAEACAEFFEINNYGNSCFYRFTFFWWFLLGIKKNIDNLNKIRYNIKWKLKIKYFSKINQYSPRKLTGETA